MDFSGHSNLLVLFAEFTPHVVVESPVPDLLGLKEKYTCESVFTTVTTEYNVVSTVLWYFLA